MVDRYPKLTWLAMSIPPIGSSIFQTYVLLTIGTCPAEAHFTGPPVSFYRSLPLAHTWPSRGPAPCLIY
jgi:hypothetical protein